MDSSSGPLGQGFRIYKGGFAPPLSPLLDTYLEKASINGSIIYCLYILQAYSKVLTSLRHRYILPHTLELGNFFLYCDSYVLKGGFVTKLVAVCIILIALGIGHMPKSGCHDKAFVHLCTFKWCFCHMGYFKGCFPSLSM